MVTTNTANMQVITPNAFEGKSTDSLDIAEIPPDKGNVHAHQLYRDKTEPSLPTSFFLFLLPTKTNHFEPLQPWRPWRLIQTDQDPGEIDDKDPGVSI